MKKAIGYIKLYFTFIWFLHKDGIKNIFKQLMTLKTIILFFIVMAVVSCEVWVPYIIYFITKNKYWLALGNTCWLFWLGPFTPFIPLCIAITLGIKDIYYRIKHKRLNFVIF